MDFIKFISGLNILLQAIVVLMFVVIFAGVFFYLNVQYKKMNQRKDDFHVTLLKALDVGSVNSIDDIFNLYKGINGYDLPNDRYRSSINNLLRSFIVKLHQVPGDFKPDAIKKWKEIITEYIKKNDELSPFSNLPDAERNIMNDLLIFLEDDKKDNAKTKLKELAGYVQSKNERIIDLEKKYKSSSITAYVGIILTVLIGIISFVMSL